MSSKLVLAFLLGVLTVLSGQRWYALEKASYMHELRISYIEGFLSQEYPQPQGVDTPGMRASVLR